MKRLLGIEMPELPKSSRIPQDGNENETDRTQSRSAVFLFFETMIETMSDRRMRLAARICGKARPFRRRQLATRLRRQSAMCGPAGESRER
ncbi:MAG: hypothetical protein IPJ30_10635 [Acidobacteria bacterium]|nr:hypothetical protein [Acidobacteriota bacterium]